MATANVLLRPSGTATAPLMPPASPEIPRLEARTLRALRRLLHSSGYIAAQELLPSAHSGPRYHAHFEVHLLRRLFARGESLDLADAVQALAPLDVSSLVEAGLLERSAEMVRSLFQVQVYNGLLFVVDYMPHEHPTDLVLPIGPSGKYLASLTIREKVRSALDLGCGCGIQALLMAHHARHVTATDINPRALALTRLNATLNGVQNLETLQGSYFEPLQGRRFDIIVANLPYVITPQNKFIYRDLGHEDDSPIRRNVEQMPSFLTEGGYAQVMLNWIHKQDQPWWEPVEAWISRRNVDAWLIYSSSMTPEQYSGLWMTVSETEQPEEYATTKEKWLQWYSEQGIERIGLGALTMRRRSTGNNWRCSVAVDRTLSEPLGAHILHLFHSQDALNRIKVPEGLLDKTMKAGEAGLEPVADQLYELHTLKGFLLRQKIHTDTARVITYLDGKTSLRRAMQKARLDMNDATMIRQILDEMIRLMNLGLIQLRS